MNPNAAERELSRKLRRERFYGWWYVCIGLGFAVLGVWFLMLGDKLWLVILRWVIAAGFLALGYAQLRSVKARQKSRGQ